MMLKYDSSEELQFVDAECREKELHFHCAYYYAFFFLFQMLLWPPVTMHAECLRVSFTYRPTVCPDPLINGACSVQEALQTLLRAEAACNPLLSKALHFSLSLTLSAVISNVNTSVCFL